MKKITLMFFMSLLSFSAFSQLALEEFETWPLAGWGIYDNGIGLNQTWQQSSGVAPQLPHSGTYAAYLDRENVPNGTFAQDWLITPAFNVPANPKLHFWSLLTQGGPQGSRYYVKMLVINGPEDIQSDINNPGWINLVPTGTGYWTENEINPNNLEYAEKILDLPASAVGQQVFLAFMMEGDSPAADRWLIDDVQVVELCAPPTALTANNISQESAQLGWANPGGATQWEILVIPQADAPDFEDAVMVPGGLPTFLANDNFNLTENTCYKFYVRAFCGTDLSNPSAWSTPFNFCTVAQGATCNAPIQITTNNYSTTDNTSGYGDDFDGAPGTGCGTTGNFLNGDEVAYSYTPTFTGVVSVSMTNNGPASGMFIYASCADVGVNCIAGGTGNATTPVNVPNLPVIAGNTYYIIISTSAAQQSTPYTLTIQQVNCPPPTNAVAEDVNESSANLSWDANGASSWEIVVQTAGAGLPTGAGTTVNDNTDYNVTATTAGVTFASSTAYEYYVRADCGTGDGTFSAWTGPIAISTTQIPATLNYTEGFEGANSGFTFNNGTQVNKWVVGTATSNGGTKSLYVSNDNGASNAFSIGTTSVVQAYRDIQMPAVVDQLSLSFDWKAQGESCCDYLRVWIVPASFTPTPGTQIAAGTNRIQIGGNYNINGTWTTVNSVVNAAAYSGQVMRIVFEWRNDPSLGTQPPAAVDNINLSVITCSAPSALTLVPVTGNTATFSWTAPATGAESYDYYVSGSTVPPNATTVPTGNVTATTETLSPLEPSTAYNIWVRSNCGDDGVSFWIGPVSFTTPQIPATMNYTQDFEAANTGFTLNNGTQVNKWVVGTATSNGGTHSLYVSNDNGVSNAFAIGTASTVQAYRDIQMPAVLDQVSLSFDWKAQGESCCDYLRVWIVPVSFTPTPGTQIAAGVGRTQIGGNYNVNGTWTTVNSVINANQYAGQVIRLVFEWRNDGSLGTQPPAAVDNINLSVITCPSPSALTFITSTETTASVSWTGPSAAPDSYDYYYSTVNTAPTAGTTPSGNVTGTTANLTELTAGTLYYFWVRSNCGEDDGTSFWVGPLSFNTTICNPGTRCDYEFVLTDDWGDGWNGNTMSVRQNGIVVGTLALTGGAGPVTVVVPLCPGIPFELFWNAGGNFSYEVGVSIVDTYDVTIYNKPFDTGSPNTLLYTGMPICTPITCPQPTNGLSSGVDNDTVLLTWTPGDAETQWEVVTQLATEPAPGAAPTDSEIVNGTPSLEVDGLTQSVFYEYYVRAICGPDDVSFWSGPYAYSIFNPPGCAAVEVFDLDLEPIEPGEEYVLCFDEPNCVELSANYFQTGATTSYEVESIDYAPPFPSTGGTQTSVNVDDVWSPVINLPFDFCFFGEVYDTAQVSSNGLLTFDEYASPGFSPYNLNSLQIPNTNFPVLNAIYGVYQDIDPSVNNDFANPDINYQVLGTYPCRALVVSFNEVAAWDAGGCEDDPAIGAQTSQIVIYEVSNVIEVYVQRRVPCVDSWNGMGVIGIQNEAGTQAYTPPGRNTGAWSVLVPEAWRFTPNGTANVEFAWFQGDDFYSSDTEITVCVEEDVTMTARATYTNCNGEEIVRESDVLISIAEEIDVEDPLDLTACSTGGDVTFDLTESLVDIYPILDPAEYTFLFYATEADAIAGLDNNLPESYTTNTSQTIWVRVFENGADCFVTMPFDLILSNNAPVFTITPDFSLCEGTSGTITITSDDPDFGDFPISWTLGTDPFPGTGPSITVTEGGVYTAIVGGTGCSDSESTTVTIIPIPVPDDPADVTACDSYTLPALAVGSYYTATGGGGTMLPADTVIETTQDIYVYAASGTTPNCVAENVFTVTIVPTPEVVTPGDQLECATYELPALAVGNYFTEPGGAGTMLNAGDDITSTQIIYVFASNGIAPDNCTDEDSFTVTINPGPVADEPADVSACDSYTLPALSADNAYYTGPEGTGTMLPADTVIETTQLIYVYASSELTPDCTDESSFTVTINTTPVVPELEDVTACNTYTLEPLANGNYFTLPGGMGTMLNAGDPITVTQTIYVYAATGTTPDCTDEDSFIVTIVPSPTADDPADVTACGSYTLLPLTSGNYFTGTGGTGTPLSAGDVIESTQQIYVYVAGVGTCFDENVFTVTIPTPVATTPGDQTACNTYTLPALAAGNYYTGPDGTGIMLNAGDAITSTQDIYVYVQSGTTPNCTAQDVFTVTITTTPAVDDPADVTECVSYELPALTAGSYYTGTGGTGTMLEAGTVIETNQTIYVYASNGGTCVAETSFTVTLIPLANVVITEGCDGNEYVLEATFDQDENYNQDTVTFVWTTAGGDELGTGVSLTIANPGTYNLTITPNGSDCSVTVPITVDDTSCMVQKGISPNGDGLNDSFDLSTLDVRNLSIFNRYGKEVFSYGNYTDQWHGQGSNGDELPTGTYFYSIERANGESRTGWIYINREEN